MTSIKNYVSAFVSVKRPLVQYLRDKQNRKVGVMVAYKYDKDTIVVGWSKVNEAAGDTFDRMYGIARAIDKNRLMPLEEFEACANEVLPNVPDLYYPVVSADGEHDWMRVSQYDDFVYRCKRYFVEKKNVRLQNSVSAE